MNPVIWGNFDEITRKAFERYILELVRGYAPEEERMFRKTHGWDRNIVIREVQLSGEYPKTCLRIRRYDHVREIENWHPYALWQNPNFFDEDGKRLRSPEQIAGDILVWARGG